MPRGLGLARVSCKAMPSVAFSWNNFHDRSTANFQPCETPNQPADFTSPSGSRYWKSQGGVIRQSDHWMAGIRSCNWYFAGATSKGPEVVGFCRWEDFCSDPRDCAAWRAERLAWLRGMHKVLCMRRTDRKLAVAGNAVRATRTVTERVSSRRWQTTTEIVCFTIKKITAAFYVATDGRRFGRHTLTNFQAA